MATAKSFEQIDVEVGKKAKAYRAWCAVWGNRGRGEVVLAAPTLVELRDRWEQITNTDLDKTLAQEVFLCSVMTASETNCKPCSDARSPKATDQVGTVSVSGADKQPISPTFQAKTGAKHE